MDLVFGTHVLHRFPEFLYSIFEKGKRVFELPQCDGVICEGIPVKRDSRFRASVPIMYGCNNFCTYCIVPYVRGRERSRAPGEIISEVKELIEKGYKEILLLGQNVNSYDGNGMNFSGLLRELDSIDGDFVINFMTSHPKDCSHELIDTIADSRHISWHLHLPVQSGSDRILKLMNRHYDVAHYMELVEYARKRIPNIQLTTDKYDSAFTFIYSKREGTKAAEMDDPVSDEEKGKWFRELLEVQGECGDEAYKKYVGQTMRILCEGRGRTDESLYTGKSRQNIIVDFNGNEQHIGQFVDVKITRALNWALVGEIIQ